MAVFQLETHDFGSFREYRLHHPDTHHGFTVVPAVAANVREIRFAGTNVLDGYATPDELRAGKWGKSAILFPFPNRLRDGRYTWRGQDYTFPLNNAATNNAIHGFVRHESFEVERIELTATRGSITSRFHADGSNASYPFRFTLDVTFSMTAQGEFIASFWVTNRHDGNIPVGLGWHPYFRLTEHANEHELHLPPCERVEIDERMIPTGTRTPYTDFRDKRKLGETQLDTCFAVSPNESIARSTLSAQGQTLTIEASPKSFPFFQVFTPPARTSIAIEPMTCNVDAFHNGEGLVDLAPEHVWAAEFRIRYDAT